LTTRLEIFLAERMSIRNFQASNGMMTLNSVSTSTPKADDASIFL